MKDDIIREIVRKNNAMMTVIMEHNQALLEMLSAGPAADAIGFMPVDNEVPFYCYEGDWPEEEDKPKPRTRAKCTKKKSS